MAKFCMLLHRISNTYDISSPACQLQHLNGSVQRVERGVRYRRATPSVHPPSIESLSKPVHSSTTPKAAPPAEVAEVAEVAEAVEAARVGEGSFLSSAFNDLRSAPQTTSRISVPKALSQTIRYPRSSRRTFATKAAHSPLGRKSLFAILRRLSEHPEHSCWTIDQPRLECGRCERHGSHRREQRLGIRLR